MDGLNREIEIRFGTRMPVPFKDAKTGLDLNLRSFGNATVVVKDTAKYPSLDDVKQKAPAVLEDAFRKAIAELDGTLDASRITGEARQVGKKTAEKLSASGLQATSVQIMNIVLTQESEEKLKAAALAPMTDDHPNPGSLPQPDIFPMTGGYPNISPNPGPAAFPKFCTNCGAKAGSRFCPECGAKLV